MPDIDIILRQRLERFYPVVISASIGLLLFVIPAYVWWRYPQALRVYIQRDDGKSNTPAFFDWFLKKWPGSRGLRRTDTNALEMANFHEGPQIEHREHISSWSGEESGPQPPSPSLIRDAVQPRRAGREYLVTGAQTEATGALKSRKTA